MTGLKRNEGWVHPETGLEYSDKESFDKGRDPIPHWRNAKIKNANARYGTGSERAKARIKEICQQFDRQGTPEGSAEVPRTFGGSYFFPSQA